MAFYFLELQNEPPQRISPDLYTILISGTAVLRSYSTDRHMILELSEGLTVRTYAEGNICYVMLRSTIEPGEVRPVRVPLISSQARGTALIAEERSRHLRQTYALLVLIEDLRLPEAVKALSGNWNADLENLLPDDHRLALEAAGEGSFWATVKRVSKAAAKAPEAAMLALSSLFKDGRRLMLEYAGAVVRDKQAEAAVKEAEATLKQVEATLKAAEADKVRAGMLSLDRAACIERADKLVDLYTKIDKQLPESDAAVIKKKLFESLYGTSPDLPRLPSR